MKTIRLLVTAVVSLSMCLIYADNVKKAYVNGTWWSYYIRYDGTAEVKSCSIDTTGHLNIPSSFEGCPVSRLLYGFSAPQITSLSIPSSVKVIEDAVFSGCNSLRGVTIPSSVVSIGSAFRGCRSLSYVRTQSGLKSIGANAFSGCISLKNVSIAESVASVGKGAFSNCDDALYDTVTIPGVRIVDGWIVNTAMAEQTEHVELRGVRGIADSAFANCVNLTNVVIGCNMLNIGFGAFRDCNSLVNIVMEDGVKNIQGSAFYGCSKLTWVSLPDSVTNVGYKAFCDCSSLTNVVIGRGVVGIDATAFYDCNRITQIVFEGNAPRVTDSFSHINYNCTAYVGKSSTGWGDIPGVWKGIAIDYAGWPFFTIENGELKAIDHNDAIAVDIPDGVTSISTDAFQKCNNVRNITIPDSVTNIVSSAFNWCNDAVFDMTTIPGVKLVDGWVVGTTESRIDHLDLLATRGIASQSFSECSSITSVAVADANVRLSSLFPCAYRTIQTVTLPKTLAVIVDSMFAGCSLLRVLDIPASVKRIGVGAFADGVKTVVFHGAPPEVVDEEGNVIDPDTYTGGGVFGPYGSIPSDVHVAYPPEFADEWGGEQCRWCGVWAGCGPDVTITPGGKTVFSGSVAVSIESSWTNAVIHYTADGVEPTEASPVYRKPITVNRPCIIKACAISPDCEWSHVVSAQFGYGRTADPYIGYSQWTTFYHRDNMVSFYSDTAGAEYVYTLDGSDPTKGGIKYTGPFSISTSTVVRVVAKSTDNVDSDVVEQTFTRKWETVGTPEIETGDMDSANVVTISCWTDDAEIWYSTGGGYQRYTGPFRIFGATTVRAYAVKDDWLQSATATNEIVKAWNDGGVVGQNGKIFVSTTPSIWREDKSVSYSGGSSLRSGAIGDCKTSDLRFSVAGKGTISFHWRTSCEEDPYMHATDYVRFLVDGVEKGRLDGISGWEAFSARIDTDGPHVLTWEYVKDGSDSDGEDCAWVDEVKFAPDAVAWIRFNGNDNTSGTLPESISHYLGEKVTLPNQGTLKRDKYDFRGWSDGSKVYGPMSVYEAPDTDVTLLAAWVPRLTPPPTIHAPEQYAGVSTNFSISASGGAAIYYTIDGSEPTEASTRYWGLPIEVTGTTVIKAIAVAEDRFPSEVVTKTVECLWRSAIVNGVTWYYTADGTLKKGVGASGKFVLPNKLNGTAITKVGGDLFWVRGSGNVSGPVAIVVPEGIVEMEYMALEGCDNLEVIVLPSTLKKIGYSCFSECNCLARVYWCMSVPPAIDQGSEGRDDGGSVYWGSNASLISYLPKGWGDLSTHRWNERAFVEWTPPANGATGMIDEIVGKIVPKVMVTFNAHGGYSEETGRAVDSGSAIGVLPVLTRTGYSFDGWYSAATGGTLFGATSKVTADITLHAHWTPIIYAIRYELEGGVNAAGNPSSYMVEQRIVLAAPRKTGYTFKGWTPNGGVIAAGSIGDRRFVAVWELNAGETAYTLMFNANGGECESSGRSVLKGGEYGELPVPTRTGYDFGGWFTASEGGSRVSDKTVAGGDATLFAHWTPILYPITYVLGGGRNAAENPATYTIEDAVVLLVPVRDGYLFTGWTPDGGRIAKGSIGERTFTATWKAPEPGTPIVVTFDANGGRTYEQTRMVAAGSAVGELPDPIRDGYVFAGWWTARASGSKIATGSIVEAATTFYAHWTPRNYNIVYVLNGGTNARGNPATYTIEDEVSLASPVRNGYTFAGWTPNGGKIATGSTGDRTFTAQWTRNGGITPTPTPTPTPGPTPTPTPVVVPELYEVVDGAAPVTAASVYNGYLYDEKSGAVKGTIQVKVGKPGKKDGAASVKATVVVGTKKVSLKAIDKGKAVINPDGPTEIELVGKGAEECVVALGVYGMSGYYGAYEIDGSRNVFTSKNKGEVAVANDILSRWIGSFMVVWNGGSLSVSIAAKGKVKVSGTLADGKTKVSASTALLIGDEWSCVSVAAQKANLAFVLWLSHDGKTIEAEGLGDNVHVGLPGTLANGATFQIDADEFAAVFGQTMLPYLPDGVPVTQKGTKWTLPKAGKVVYKNGAPDESKLGDNPCGLKLTYKSKDGTFKGSFKVYAEVKGKPKATTVNVTGFMLNGIGYGTATIKKVGSVPISIE